LAFVLHKGALKGINSALDKRAEEIKDQLEEARRLREEAQTLLASYMRKQKEAEDQAEAANAEAQAMAEVKAKAADVALNAAESLLRDTLKPADHSKLIKDGIAQMGKVLN